MVRALGFAFVVTFAAACTPSIGDKCTLSTDCSSRGDRLCDNTQPGGYCTISPCEGNGCPDDGTCVQFYPNEPGCPANDRVVARSARTFCVAGCAKDSDCRDGYVCANAGDPPWSARILDDDHSRRTCLVRPAAPASPLVDAGVPAVCRSGPFDAGTYDAAPKPPFLDAGVSDGGSNNDGGPTDAGDSG